MELLVNGEVVSRQGPINDPKLAYLSSPGFVFEIEDYQPGEIVVNGLINGEVKASDKTRTPTEPVAVHLELDAADRQFIADGSDIVVAYANVVDENDTIIRDVKMEVKFSVSGPAEIVGDKTVKGANPMTMTRNGSAPAMIRAGIQSGTVVVRAEVSGLKATEASVTSLPYNSNYTTLRSLPIFDLERVRVDLGEKGQLVQFGWTPWFGENNVDAELELSDLGGFRATLRTGSDEGITRWLGEMNVKGYNGFVSGEGVCVIDPQGLALEFSGLPEGRYSLTTYHHAPRSNTNSMDPNRERLKTLKIHEIPVAQKLVVEAGRSRDNVTISSGNQLPEAGPGKAVVRFTVNGQGTATVKIKDSEDDAKGIWLNGFELKQAR